MRSLLNLYHFATGQRELNFTKKEVIERIIAEVKSEHGNMPIEEKAEILISVNTNVGLMHYSVPVQKHSIENYSVDIAMKMQESRILVENERTRVTRQRFESMLPQCGLFAHVYQMKGFYKGKEQFRVNCFVLIEGDYFPACVLSKSEDIDLMNDLYPNWDISLFQQASQSQVVLFLESRPWELRLVFCERVVFL